MVTRLEAAKIALKYAGVSEKEIIEAKKEAALNKVIVQYATKLDLANKLLEIQPMYYDQGKNWWVWNHYDLKWEIKDEVDIMNLVKNLSNANTINSKEKNEILESLKQESRIRIPKAIKPTWIQFKEDIIDIVTGEKFKATPEYFVTNPIPYPLNEDNFEMTPTMDKIFEEWVGKDNVKLLYQIIAYCLLPSYPIHRLFCFIGAGMNGKSSFLNLIEKFLGNGNVCSTELDSLMKSRFEMTKLHKKLVCVMGETNFTELSQTSKLKKLTGGDLISFEYKNKTPFDDRNYAKIIISTNNLPTTTDKTIGFYRRWLIVDFPHQFSEKKDIISSIPEEEYSALALKSCNLLNELLKERKFHKEGSIEERTKKYEDRSNPFDKFWEEYIEEDFSSHIWKFDFEKKFHQWCIENRFRAFSEMAIGIKMKDKQVTTIQKTADWLIDGKYKTLRAWAGIKWKDTQT